MVTKKLDFIIIGAQKSGTTSLYKYLSCHPQIYMPPEKEAPFFNDDALYEQGWDRYAEDFFGEAPYDRLWGKATPHYMLDSTVPGHIAQMMPQVKLIALLRHPIERAMSHYKMFVRWGMEKRTFDEAVDQLLTSQAIERSRSLRSTIENNRELYITGGEYGRILGKYLIVFNRNQILVVFTEKLRDEPRSTIGEIYQFLKVSSDFIPPNLGKVYHKGGVRRRIPRLAPENLKRLTPIRWIWCAFTEQFRRRFSYWFNQWNVAPDKNGEATYLSPENHERLRRFYQKDVALLEAMIGVKAPWLDLRQ